MAVTAGVAALACGQVFARICAVGKDVPADTPAAGFLAAAARRVDRASGQLAGHQQPPSAEALRAAQRDLAVAETILHDVMKLQGQAVTSSVDRLSVVVHHLCMTLRTDDAQKPAE